MAQNNSKLLSAKKITESEYFTNLSDIEKELEHYYHHFEGKTVLCNCNDSIDSNFTKFFILKFHDLKLKSLICTFFKDDDAFVLQYDGQDLNGDGIVNYDEVNLIKHHNGFQYPLSPDPDFIKQKEFECNKNGIYAQGDFRSKHCIEYLKMADIVVTNPPSFLFKEFISQLVTFNKKFLIIGSDNARTYKETGALIMNNTIWNGVNHVQSFFQPNGTNVRFGNISWYTNLDHEKRHENLLLFRHYNTIDYPHFDNYNAINVDKVSDIPMDFDGVMGVPISFLDKYNPNQFELIDARTVALNDKQKHKHTFLIKDNKDTAVNGKNTYVRICIKFKKLNNSLIA